MKSKNILFFAAIILIALTVVYGFLRYRNLKLLEQGFNSTGSATTTAQANWLTYTNTKYSYALQYQKNGIIQPLAEEERLPIEESGAVGISIPGLAGGIEIIALVPYYGTSTPSNPFNESVKGDLLTFAQVSRQKFVDDKNPNFPNKKIGDLEEITFAGHKAYAATVTGYTDSHGSDTFRYIYVENGNYKFVIQYSLKGNLSKQIIDTFTFLN